MAASSRHRTPNQYKRHLKVSLKTCFNKVSFSNRSFFKQIHNVETQDSHWFKLVQQTFLHQLSFLSLPLREKLLNWELFGWAVGYRKLRTELQRGDSGRVWLWRRGSGRGPAVSFGPLLLGYLCALSLETVRTWRNISRWRGHEDPNNYYTFIGGWWWCMAWVIIERERAMVHEDLGFSI